MYTAMLPLHCYRFGMKIIAWSYFRTSHILLVGHFFPNRNTVMWLWRSDRVEERSREHNNKLHNKQICSIIIGKCGISVVP